MSIPLTSKTIYVRKQRNTVIVSTNFKNEFESSMQKLNAGACLAYCLIVRASFS